MNRKSSVALLLIAQSFIISGLLFALTGTEIAQKAHDIDDPKTSHSAVQMDLINKDGKVDSRMVEEWAMDDASDLGSTVIVFRKPSSVANTRFLQKENDDRDDDKWIYLPALKRVRRIASSEGSKSFMGTDMSYDDMETREVEQDTHELLGEEKFGKWDCYKVKGKAVDSSDSQYSYRITWFDKESFVPVKAEMYDKNEKLIKVLEVEKLQKVSGYWTPLDGVLSNVQTGHFTRVTILKIEYDKGVSTKLFTTNFLKRGK